MYGDVGAPGRCNDSQLYEPFDLKALINGSNIFESNAKEIEGIMVPINILGDSAFRFSKNLMKPYPFSATAEPREKKFNYHLSTKCRRVVENAFDHLKARFRRLGKGLELSPINVNLLIKCACVLHNFITKTAGEHLDNAEQFQHEHPEDVRVQPNSDMTIGDRRREAEIIREALALHFQLFAISWIILRNLFWKNMLSSNCRSICSVGRTAFSARTAMLSSARIPISLHCSAPRK